MIGRASLRRRLAWAALVVLLGSVVASLRLRHRRSAVTTPAVGCAGIAHDSLALSRFAADTIAQLRGRSQRVTRFARSSKGVEVRTEDVDPLADHDGGLVAFDCARRVTFLWLDGG
jgi:hypothetical protein